VSAPAPPASTPVGSSSGPAASAASPGADAARPTPGRLNARALILGLAAVLPLLAILLLNLGRDPHTVRSPLVGRPAPPFSLAIVGSGEPVTLESLRGKPAVINFWATWCGPCYQEHPALVASARRMGSEVQFLGIIYDDEEQRVRDFLEQKGSSYPSLLDPGGRTAIAFGVRGVPETYFLDANGRITQKFVGPLDPETIAQYVAEARRSAP
jgi:cytochrome c biogenesis protein CcmG/thiol:disulfide interchange protein DsbE